MTLSLYNITFVLGFVLIVLGVLGGGLEIKEIKIPTLPVFLRAASFVLGCVFLYLCWTYPEHFDHTAAPSAPPLAPAAANASPPQPPEKSTPPAPIASPPKKMPFSRPILLAYARDQKALADKLNEALGSKGYLINEHLDDFSGIRPDAHERPGTIRIVYKHVVKAAEVDLVDAMRDQFPSDMPRLVESENNNASVDLQVQLW